MQKTKRTSDEIIVLSLSVLCVMGLALFLFIRLQRGDYTVALVDGVGFLGSLAIFAYVYRTHETGVAGFILGLGALTGSVLLVALQGPEERYLLYPTIAGVFFLMPPKWALMFAVIAVTVSSALILPDVEMFVLAKFLLSISGSFLFAYIFASERNDQRDVLLSLSTLDPLTGAGNRRAFDNHVEELLRMRERNPVTVSLLLMDIDNFKAVNDTQGHDAGDRVLKLVATIINDRMRAGDHAFRYGGDEFAIVAQGESVVSLAENLCARVADFASGESLSISASVGIATLVEGETAVDWIKRSDTALYSAKREGKNRVCAAPDVSVAESDAKRTEAAIAHRRYSAES